ncbi:MAG: sigma-70 family RNA polymerase sigma factor [Proteobacteria bacterium]|nr:sigma-70 family RNA polymerase sigma factor [Pseudomonadota bacterium]
MEHRGDLLKYASRIVRDEAAAEDVVQEAYLRFSARSGQIGEINQPLGYLYRIVRNLALDWASRASAQAPITASSTTIESVPHDAPSAEQVLYYRDELRILGEAVAELPERTRIAFRMYKLEGRSLQEVAARLNVSVVRAHQLVKEAALHAARRLCGDED